MCELKRRDLLLGASAMLLYGCGDAEKYNQGKDYYPVATSSGLILHWGQNNSITIDSDFFGSPSSSLVNIFETGLNQWSSTLSQIGVTLNYSSTNPDVKVHWYTASEMETKTGITPEVKQALVSVSLLSVFILVMSSIFGGIFLSM